MYCSIDDFWKDFKKEWDKHLIDTGKNSRGPQSSLSVPEMITIIIFFHQSGYRTFKNFYSYVSLYHKKDFPNLISYSRFVHLTKNIFLPLFAYLLSIKGDCTGISFIDSTVIKVCHNKRISRNKVFKGLASTGKSTSGWFYGFKLHLIINDRGEILSFLITPGNVSDVKVAEKLSNEIYGKLFGDKGYISSKLFKKLLEKGIQLVTSIRSNMKSKLMHLEDKILLRKRSLIETVNDQLKNISQIEHTRHRSPSNFLVNILGGLAAYCHQEKKPSLNYHSHERNQLLAA